MNLNKVFSLFSFATYGKTFLEKIKYKQRETKRTEILKQLTFKIPFSMNNVFLKRISRKLVSFFVLAHPLQTLLSFTYIPLQRN